MSFYLIIVVLIIFCYFSHSLEFPSGDLRGGVINLFGRIATESVTAIMRGLVLVVTLKKLLPGSQFNWPRLLTTEKAMKWLKYYQKFAEVENEDLDDDYTGKFNEIAEKNVHA